MPTVLTHIAERHAYLESAVANTPAIKGPGDYADDPVGYAREILHFDPTPDQCEIADKLLVPPHRVLAPSGHKYGKSATAGWLTNWFHDSFDPGICITTAPKMDSVKRIIWKEVRRMRNRAGLGGLQPRAPEMFTSEDHIAFGMTASSGEGFQGNHELRSFFIFDEAVKIDPVFWEVTRTMFKPESGHMWLCLFNPTDTTSQAFIEDNSVDIDGRPRWATVRLDCLRHPNIVAQLAGRDPVIPSAVSLPMIEEWVASWCDPVVEGEQQATDLQWPPEGTEYAKIRQPKWYKQGPEFQARCRGMWPEGGTYSVWSDLLWRACADAIYEPRQSDIPEIGCDVARFGNDYTSIHVRWGDSSYLHESHQGWDTTQTTGRLIEIAVQFAAMATANLPAGSARVDPKTLPIKIDDDGIGGAVTDQLMAAGYFAVPILASTPSLSGRYDKRRSELWFQVAERAREKRCGFGRIGGKEKERMRQQAMAVSWQLTPMGMRQVEPKDVTKENIGRSPDDMDSCNLAYLSGFEYSTKFVGEESKRPTWGGTPAQPKRSVWGK